MAPSVTTSALARLCDDQPGAVQWPADGRLHEPTTRRAQLLHSAGAQRRRRMTGERPRRRAPRRQARRRHDGPRRPPTRRTQHERRRPDTARHPARPPHCSAPHGHRRRRRHGLPRGAGAGGAVCLGRFDRQRHGRRFGAGTRAMVGEEVGARVGAGHGHGVARVDRRGRGDAGRNVGGRHGRRNGRTRWHVAESAGHDW